MVIAYSYLSFQVQEIIEIDHTLYRAQAQLSTSLVEPDLVNWDL